LIFVDSSVWIGYFDGATDAAVSRLDAVLQTDEHICIAGIVLTEVLQGFRRDRDFDFARRTLAGIDRLRLSSATYVNAARLYRRLRARGATAKTIDCVVAQACLESGATLLTGDRDFAVIARNTRLRLAVTLQRRPKTPAGSRPTGARGSRRG
jgi:predicted nucleic acid-binding protein